MPAYMRQYRILDAPNAKRKKLDNSIVDLRHFSDHQDFVMRDGGGEIIHLR
jgi:hypothetical protein